MYNARASACENIRFSVFVCSALMFVIPSWPGASKACRNLLDPTCAISFPAYRRVESMHLLNEMGGYES